MDLSLCFRKLEKCIDFCPVGRGGVGTKQRGGGGEWAVERGEKGEDLRQHEGKKKGRGRTKGNKREKERRPHHPKHYT